MICPPPAGQKTPFDIASWPAKPHFRASHGRSYFLPISIPEKSSTMRNYQRIRSASKNLAALRNGKMREMAWVAGVPEPRVVGSGVSPRSGRMKIAQQFTAGISAASREEVREADG